MNPILTSIIDQDLYKLTMQKAVARLYPAYRVRYRFINRGGTYFPTGFAALLREQIDHMASLIMKPDERKFLEAKCGKFLDPFYIDYLSRYQYDPSEVFVSENDGNLSVEITGYWHRSIMWEVPLMALISELYFQIEQNPVMTSTHIFSPGEVNEKTRQKAINLSSAGVDYSDFGTRRRYSKKNHNIVVNALSNNGGSNFKGTSNIRMAMDFDLLPIGTQAHEWFMWHAAKYGYRMANATALGRWVDVYHGDLGIALTDTYTSEVFFEAFDTLHAKLYDGVRHDSGDPISFGEKVISHYERLNIDPKSKKIVFSDGLSDKEACHIKQHFENRIVTNFGIGTFFTNDVGVKPLNMVIKMVEAFIDGKWVETVKLSDNKGKNTGSSDAVRLANQTLGLT